MDDLPEHLFANPVWHALQTAQRHCALSSGDAARYPANLAPFAAVAAPTASALRDLHSLLSPGESLWLLGPSFPVIPELTFEEPLVECHQMILPTDVAPAALQHEIVPLTHAHAAEMVALTSVAFPGFFRSRTCEMGTYYGVRFKGELIAMAGERIRLNGFPEISGVCTHPQHRGKGLAAALIGQLVRDHRRAGLVSWLNVDTANLRAFELYLRLGFRAVRKVQVRRVTRNQ